MRAMRIALLLLLALLAAAAVVASSSLHGDDHASLQAEFSEPPIRDAAAMRAQLGMVELDAEAETETETEAESEAEAESETDASSDALVEVDASTDAAVASEAELSVVASSQAAGPSVFFLDESDTERVFVEAESEADAADQTTQQQTQQQSQQSESSNPGSVVAAGSASAAPSSPSELLYPRMAPAEGQTAPANTFLDAPGTSVRPERSGVVSRRMERARYGLAKKAWKEHAAEYANYQHKLHQWQWARAVEQSRQSNKFQRPLQNSVALPAASSNAAALGGDRNHNRLFPAATPLSDGKASSQNEDFHHRGFGDQVPNHTGLVEARTEAAVSNEVQAQAQQNQQSAVAVESSAQSLMQTSDAGKTVNTGAPKKKKHAAAAAAAPMPDVVAIAPAPADAAAAMPAGPAEAAPAMPAGPAEVPAGLTEAASAAPVDPAAAAAAVPMDAASFGSVPPAAPAADASAAGGFVPYAPAQPAFVPPPNLANQPCYDQCNAAGAWVSAACQDCIVRGMVNGWIVRSIVDQQKGYNYAHYARNKCVAYVNELQARGGEVKGAPFAHCFFQRMHETCNL